VNDYVDYASFVALIDDDEHSAHLLTRTLVAHSAPGVQCYGDASAALMRLKPVLSDPSASRPALIIVDLKAHSNANLEFLAANGQLIRQHGVPLVVMSPLLEEQSRRALLDSGASAVFVRHADRDAYRRVAGDIVEFWAHSQRPVAVGM
jgi:DNA-binding response OmpR family regulator